MLLCVVIDCYTSNSNSSIQLYNIFYFKELETGRTSKQNGWFSCERVSSYIGTKRV